jgi:hypothetical protein
LNGRTKKVVAVRNRFSDVSINSHSKPLLASQIEGFNREFILSKWRTMHPPDGPDGGRMTATALTMG